MRIDFHAHLFDSWKGVRGMSADAMVREMDRHRVDRAVVFTMNGFWGDFRHANDILHRATRSFADRLVPFGTVHPYDRDAALGELERCRAMLGMKGIKLHPWLQGFSVTSDEMRRVAERAAELDLILVFHDGTPPYCEPLQIADLAHRFPSLRVVLGHAGLKDYPVEAIAALRRHENLWAGTNLPPRHLERACREMDGERILFGSDMGFGSLSLAYYLSVVDSLEVPDRIKEKILGGNAERLLGNR